MDGIKRRYPFSRLPTAGTHFVIPYAGIGHIQLDKLQPHHLQAFYKNLAEEGVKKSNEHAIAKNLGEEIKALGLTKAAFARSASLAANTISVACQEKRVSLETAQKIANALNKDIDSVFEVTKIKEALSEKTILHHRLISSILESAVKWQVIYDNPAKRVEPPKVHKKETAYLDDKQALEVIETLEHTPLKWRAAVMLLVYSGMRRGELCGLTWGDIDFDNQLLHINKANQYLASKGIFEKETKNTSSERVIKLPDDMFHLLGNYKTWQADEKQKMGDRWEESGKVFTQANGRPIHPGSITAWVKKFTKENNLPKFTPHSLRHTNATLLIMSGVPVKAVSARLGHADQNVTNAIYSHTIQTADAMASDVVGDVFKRKAGKDNNT